MRKIAVFTGTRAEYGLLYWIIKELHESPMVSLQLLVGGMHLSPEFGYTVKQIEKDDFPIAERMEFVLSSDSSIGIGKSIGLATISGVEALDRHKPDILVLLGDRFEALALAQSAMVSRVPIAHIHGGEITEGLIDEAIRHSITKMSHLHFVATETYRKRVIQLGENPEKVFNYGAPGIDNIIRLPLLSRSQLGKAIGFDLSRPFFLVTYHPVTLERDGSVTALQSLLRALDEFPDHQVVLTYPNADMEGRNLMQLLKEYQEAQPKRVMLGCSLGQLAYLSLMKYCDVVIGNSSSGIIEAPTFQVPTVNVGNRQRGRISGETVVNCEETFSGISQAISKALSKKFSVICKRSENPYGTGNSAGRIADALINTSLEKILNKSFFDVEFV